MQIRNVILADPFVCLKFRKKLWQENQTTKLPEGRACCWKQCSAPMGVKALNASDTWIFSGSLNPRFKTHLRGCASFCYTMPLYHEKQLLAQSTHPLLLMWATRRSTHYATPLIVTSPPHSLFRFRVFFPAILQIQVLTLNNAIYSPFLLAALFELDQNVNSTNVRITRKMIGVHRKRKMQCRH